MVRCNRKACYSKTGHRTPQMSKPLSFQINGQLRQLDVPTPSTLDVVVGQLGLRADRVAVERNGEIVPRAEWETTEIENGDRLEVVHFVGGGFGEKTGASSR